MEKIFLDFGANKLQGLCKVFKNKLNIDESWIIQCYEPNIYVFNNLLNEIQNPKCRSYMFYKYKNLKLYNLAISDKSGEEKIKNITHYALPNGKLRAGNAGGSTLLKDIIWHQKGVEFEVNLVKTIDVNEILSDLYLRYKKNMEIYIKCDIEGYEYIVIRRLLESKHINLIKAIYVEWHPHFFENEIEKKVEAFNLINYINCHHPNVLISTHY
jgi:FkbM family methyltransferase